MAVREVEAIYEKKIIFRLYNEHMEKQSEYRRKVGNLQLQVRKIGKYTLSLGRTSQSSGADGPLSVGPSIFAFVSNMKDWTKIFSVVGLDAQCLVRLEMGKKSRN